MRETERRCDALIASSRDPIAYVHEGMHIRANDAYLEMFGYDHFEDIEGISLLDMVAARAPDGFDRIEDVLDAGELGTLRDAYRATSQEDVAALNSRPPTLPVPPRIPPM